MSVARRGESGAAIACSYWRLRQRRIKSSTEATRRRWAAAARASRSRWAAEATDGAGLLQLARAAAAPCPLDPSLRRNSRDRAPAEMMKLARLAGANAFHHECDLSLHRAVEFVDRAAARVTAAFRGHSTCIIFLVVRAGGAESSSNAAVYREPTWPSEIGRCRAPLIYVSRTEISCTPPQCGHLTLSVAFQAARRLCTSVSMPVGACWRVVGQVKNREVICGSFPCTGGSATGLSATGA